MRVAVTGAHGQVAKALAEKGKNRGDEIIPLFRPDFDLHEASTIYPAIDAMRPDVVISAAAYTAVDAAENDEDAALAINAVAAGIIAQSAARLNVPVIHLSTDYVFDGSKPSPYVETDAPNPLCVYGVSKLEGERLLAEATPDHVILRTSWVYSPFGRNFVRTMLRLARQGDRIRVVDDQRGCPTSALDLADAILTIAEHLVGQPEEMAFRGVFHVSAVDDASWADFAEAVFETSRILDGPVALVERIASSDYPTAARRPTNSRLGGQKLNAIYGIELPSWRRSLPEVVARLLAADF